MLNLVEFTAHILHTKAQGQLGFCDELNRSEKKCSRMLTAGQMPVPLVNYPLERQSRQKSAEMFQ